MGLPRVDIDKPKFDQSTYWGRFQHFFLLCNPLNILATAEELDRARDIVTRYRDGKDVPECKTIDDVWQAKYLYDSAFHPDTGEKQIIVGRMSSQMPVNTIITGCMLIFYKSTKAVVFWQWFNQTFNAIVNFSNRSGASSISYPQLGISYCLATGGALGTALSMNRAVRNMNPLLSRLVPFVAVAAGNGINIPVMRSQELIEGVSLLDEKNKELGKSKKAAAIGIFTVVMSRVAMAVPTMTLTPVLMNSLERRGILAKDSKLSAPLQVLIIGSILIFSTPAGCALFPQRFGIPVDSLEPEVRDSIKKQRPDLPTVWYNKGL
ncbi:sideroflexin-1-3-like [Drosophila bipectinata]|uniref:sideroflexin-1-3-like n=1 Tax=Drosophila bipectinata TaxID=42026 RepID=UPI001C890B5F|nr:sideroflexin-1-3-like [Drosophila bipectinata]